MSALLLGALTVICGILLPLIVKKLVALWNRYQCGKQLHGPSSLPIIGCAHHFAKHGVEGWMRFLVGEGRKAHNAGEGYMRFWNMHTLFVFPLDGAASKDILDSMEEISKGSSYNFIQPWLGVGLLISTNDKWKSRRRMLTPTFHFQMLDSYIQTFAHETDILVDILERYADTGKEVDLFPYVKRCALDIICGTAMGKTYQAQINVDHPYVTAVTDFTNLTVLYTLTPWMWFAPAWHLSGYHSYYKKLLHTLKSFTVQVIKERQEEVEKYGFDHREGRKAFLDMLLEMKGQNELNEEDIREEVDTFMFEGHDTTASGTAWALWCLAKYPDVQKKVYEEIMEVIGPHAELTANNLKQLSYLDRVLKEVMRMFPPVPMVQRELQKEFKTGKYSLAAGTEIVISPMLHHYNEKAFPDPYKFDPDRFLPDNISKRHAYDYIPFSAGPRNCIGQKFAVMEEKTIVAAIIRSFEIYSDVPFDDNIACTEVVLKPSLGVPVKIKKRL